MHDRKRYYVYILASRSRTIYVGVTSNLAARGNAHRTHVIRGFTSKYNVNRLVYYEETTEREAAIAREKQLKGWRRDKKTKLIQTMNPAWHDLTTELLTG